MLCKTFRVYLYGPFPNADYQKKIVDGQDVLVARGGGQPPPLGMTFERLAESLQTLPRLFFEWDGSFTLAGAKPASWQVEGMAYDAGNAVQYIDLTGTCPEPAWCELMTAIYGADGAGTALLLPAAVLLPLDDLQRLLWSHPKTGS